MIAALSDVPYRICRSKKGDPKAMLDLLDTRHASKRSMSWVAIMQTIFSKRNNGKEHLSKFINKFDSLFSQLESFKETLGFVDDVKVGLFLRSLQKTDVLQSTMASMKLQDHEKLTWKAVTSDLLQVWNQEFLSRSKSVSNTDEGGGKRFAGSTSDAPYNYCGEKGHSDEKCWWNPKNSRNRIKEFQKDRAHGKAAEKAKYVDQTEKSSKKKPIEFGSTAMCKTENYGKLQFKSYARSHEKNARSRDGRRRKWAIDSSRRSKS